MYMSNEDVWIIINIGPYFKKESTRYIRASRKIKTSIFNLIFLSHFCTDSNTTKVSTSPVKYLSNVVFNVFVAYKIWHLLTNK